MKELEDASAEVSKGLVKATSAWQHSKENLASESKALAKVYICTHIRHTLRHTYEATSAWQHSKENLAFGSKALAKVNVYTYTHLRSYTHTHTHTHTQANKSLSDLEKTLSSNKSKVSKASDSVKAITDDVAACTERLSELQRQRQGLQAGCDADSKEVYTCISVCVCVLSLIHI